ncbi:uncharacterized protein VTP21DRAFT_11423 [Calcarisporiella thermophila]|uniref:uncharacterized protein n=1 Tax=Calcarisporiella thermophila TaxID=911321 RepID=UPI003742B209
MDNKIPKPTTDVRMEDVNKEKALERKRQVTELSAEAKRGQLPSNEAILSGLDSISSNEKYQKIREKMSDDGKQAMRSVDRIVATMKEVIQEKNKHGQLQRSVFHATRAGGNLKGPAKRHAEEAAAVASGSEHDHSTAEIAHLSSTKALHVARILITSTQFRKLINDINNIAQDTVRSRVPRNERLNHQPGDRFVSVTESTPNTSNDTQADQEATREGIKSDMEKTARTSIRPLASSAKEIVAPHFERYESGDAKLKDVVGASAKEIATNVREAATSIEFTPEQRDQLTERFRGIMLEAHSKNEYREALEDFLQLLSELKQRILAASDRLKTAPETDEQLSKQGAKSDARIARESAIELIENFAGGKSLRPLENAFTDLINDARTDKELDQWQKDLYTFVEKSLRDEQYVRETKYKETGSELIERARHVLVEKHRDHVNRLSDAATDFIQALRSDELTSQLGRDFEQLGRDLFLNSEGKASFKPGLARDFAMLLPLIAEELKYIPLPAIEGSNKDADYRVENIVLGITHILPSYVRFRTDARFHAKAGTEFDFENRLHMTLSHVQAAAKDVSFYLNKKKGFPRMREIGLADIVIPGRGITVDLVLRPRYEKEHALDLESCKVTISSMKLKLHDTSRDFLYKILNPIIKSVAKKQARKAIEESIRRGITAIDRQIVALNKQAAQKASEKREQAAEKAKNLEEKAQDVQQRGQETRERREDRRETGPLSNEVRSRVRDSGHHDDIMTNGDKKHNFVSVGPGLQIGHHEE